MMRVCAVGEEEQIQAEASEQVRGGQVSKHLTVFKYPSQRWRHYKKRPPVLSVHPLPWQPEAGEGGGQNISLRNFAFFIGFCNQIKEHNLNFNKKIFI